MHLKMGRTTESLRGQGDGRLRPAAGRDGLGGEPAQGADPRPPQRREPRGRPAHLAMIRFHNRVVDKLPASCPAADSGSGGPGGASSLHYQWMMRTDYLPRICDAGGRRRRVHQRAQGLRGRRRPAEHADDADRVLGRGVPARPPHGAARSTTGTAEFPDGAASLDLLFFFSGTSGDLGGNTRLPSNWIADWRRLYEFGEVGRDDLERAARRVQLAPCASTRCW